MMLVQTLLVRNEEDIIAHNLRYHLDAGVDLVIVTDHNSTDSTRSIIESFTDSGQVVLRSETSPEFRQSEWVTAMADRAFSLGADWIINGDADEFWWPTRSDLRTAFSEAADSWGALLVHRHDFVTVTQSAASFDEACIYRKNISTNSDGEPLPPKVAHRGVPDVAVHFGNHEASAPGLGPVLDDGRLVIFHFPIRSYEGFSDKINVGATALEQTSGIDAGIGKTWRRLKDMSDRGDLRNWYNDHTIDQFAIEDALVAGEIVLDTRLRTRLRELEAQPNQAHP